MLRLIGVGDNTVDTYLHERRRYPGGNAVNVAVHAHRLGAEAAYLGSLGDDARGDLIRAALSAEGVDISRCQIHPDAANAFAEVNLVDGDRVFGDYSAGAAALLTLSAEDLNYIHTFDIVHSSMYSYLENQMQALRDASRWLSFDFSSDLDEMDIIRRWLPFVDLAICSLSEHPHLDVREVAQEFKAQGPQLVLITRGQQGSWAYDGENLYHQEIIPTDVVDTLGAGDAYIAAFLVEYARSADVSKAMRRGAEYAAVNCTYSGAFGYGQEYPTG